MPIKRPHYRAYEREMKYVMLPQRKTIKNAPIAFYAFLYAPKSVWFNQNSKAKKRDLDNFLKSLVDAVSRSLGFDDSWIFEIHAHKCISERQRVDVCLTDTLMTELPSFQ